MTKTLAASLLALTLALAAGCARTPDPTGTPAVQGKEAAAGRLNLSVSSATSAGARSGATTATGLPLDTAWKKQEYAFAVKNLLHPSWGLTHSERDLQIALALAGQEHLSVDRDVLFAAAYLHDLGGIGSFAAQGVDHAVRSAQLAPALLQTWGFPQEKVSQVKDVILGHVYYGTTPPTSPEAIVFHDADLLDFLGTMGIIRLAAATQDGGPSGTLASSMKAERQFATELPPKLLTAAARDQAKIRVAEMTTFFDALDPYTLGGNAL